MRADNDGAAWHRLIGLDDVVAHDRRYALLAIEGSKDTLAAADFAYWTGMLAEMGVMCALVSGMPRRNLSMLACECKSSAS
jgi:hypothetical protein